jgi:hypothetical protein
MVSWTIRTANGMFVDTIYYSADCDEHYIRAAEDLPDSYTLTRG